MSDVDDKTIPCCWVFTHYQRVIECLAGEIDTIKICIWALQGGPCCSCLISFKIIRSGCVCWEMVKVSFYIQRWGPCSERNILEVNMGPKSHTQWYIYLRGSIHREYQNQTMDEVTPMSWICEQCKVLYNGKGRNLLRPQQGVNEVHLCKLGNLIFFLWYKQQVSIYKGKYNKVSKTDEDMMWWP